MPKLTSEQLKRMTNAEIQALWIQRQTEQRKAGRPHYEVLIALDGSVAVDMRGPR